MDKLLKTYTDSNILKELLKLLSSIPVNLDKTYQRLINHILLKY